MAQFQLDKMHSEVNFKVKHLMISTVSGLFSEFDSTVETDGDDFTNAKINFTITVAVAYNSNPASLDNIEQLVISVLAVIPNGYIVSSVERPTVTTVGASTLLIADVRVSTYYTQT